MHVPDGHKLLLPFGVRTVDNGDMAVDLSQPNDTTAAIETIEEGRLSFLFHTMVRYL